MISDVIESSKTLQFSYFQYSSSTSLLALRQFIFCNIFLFYAYFSLESIHFWILSSTFGNSLIKNSTFQLSMSFELYQWRIRISQTNSQLYPCIHRIWRMIKIRPSHLLHHQVLQKIPRKQWGSKFIYLHK